MKLLITGFDPFGGEKINPSYEAVKALPDKINGIRLIKKEIPTVFIESGEIIARYIEEYDPNYIILVGQAGGRKEISFEKLAINLMEAAIDDNLGHRPIDKPVVEGGDLAYFTNLPIKNMVKAVRSKGLPANISYTAGTFVCNSSFYQVLNLINVRGLDIKAGFIHVPFIKEQVIEKNTDHFYMDIEEISEALISAIKVLKEEDINKINFGKIC